MSGSTDIHKALNTVWDASGLEALFTAYWESGVGEFLALHDQEAAPGNPFPYCTFRLDPSTTTDRMSGGTETIREIRNVPLTFTIHTRRMSAQSDSEKVIGSTLLNKVLEVFGGHPTVKPTAITLDNGKHLITTYQNDFGVRTGDDEYAWVVNYLLKVDVPVQALTA